MKQQGYPELPSLLKTKLKRMDAVTENAAVAVSKRHGSTFCNIRTSHALGKYEFESKQM